MREGAQSLNLMNTNHKTGPQRGRGEELLKSQAKSFYARSGNSLIQSAANLE